MDETKDSAPNSSKLKRILVDRTPLFRGALKDVVYQKSTRKKCVNNQSETVDKANIIPRKITCSINDRAPSVIVNNSSLQKEIKITIQNDSVKSCESKSQNETETVPQETEQFNQRKPNQVKLNQCISVDEGIFISDEKFPKEQIFSISKLLIEIEKEKLGFLDYAPKVCEDLKHVLKQIRGCDCRLYGSYNSGYPLETSDINIELFSQNDAISSRFLLEVSKIIERAKPDFQVTYESSLKLVNAFISCIEPKKGLICKIQYLGPTSTYFRTSNLIRKLIDMDARVRTLIIVLRHWAEVCSIHEASNEKLNSLCYVLMTLHFLQQIEPPILPVVDIFVDKDGVVSYKHIQPFRTYNKQTVGELWLNLLNFYGSYNWRQHVVNISNKNMVLKVDTGHSKSWIAIQAPLDKKINLAKPIVSADVSQFFQNCFIQSYNYFSEPITQASSSSEEFNEGDIRYNYSFKASNFTEGFEIPLSCPMCEELGYTCDECFEDEDSALTPLPKMTEEFKEQLDAALKELYKEYILDEKGIEHRKEIVKTIENYIKEKFPNAKLDLMGSSVNGFGLKNSDMDISLIFKSCENNDVDDVEKLKEIRQHLRRSPDFSCVLGIFGAKIPLVQFVHKESGLRGDISMYNLLAFRNTELLQTYSKIDERCRILGCAMKMLAKNSGLANAAEKSLSSYSYILLVIYYLQRTDPPVLPALQELPRAYNEERIVEGKDTWFFKNISRLKFVWKYFGKNKQSVGELWMGLLQFYTEELDFNEVISIRNSKMEYIEEVPLKNARLFNIQDPFIESKNLGFLMSEIMSTRTGKTFLRARKLLSMPTTQVPTGFSDFKEYLFDPMNLTDGRLNRVIECSLCGKFGHSADQCGRNNFISKRGRGRGRSNFASKPIKK